MNHKIVILGASGMLGSAFFNRFKNDKNVFFVTKNPKVLGGGNNIIKWDYRFDNVENLPEAEYYINCIGLIKPFVNDTVYAIYVNSILPHELNYYVNKKRAKLIHISTDCVYSGKQQTPYTESCIHDAEDVYGKTKSLGEPNGCMVLRTSIIGREIHKYVSLVSWYLNYDINKPMEGYINHLWNGITTNEYVRICEIIINNDLYKPELFHIFSPRIISKYELLTLLEKKFKRGINIIPTKNPLFINRGLSTEKNLNSILNINQIEEQIENL